MSRTGFQRERSPAGERGARRQPLPGRARLGEGKAAAHRPLRHTSGEEEGACEMRSEPICRLLALAGFVFCQGCHDYRQAYFVCKRDTICVCSTWRVYVGCGLFSLVPAPNDSSLRCVLVRLPARKGQDKTRDM